MLSTLCTIFIILLLIVLKPHITENFYIGSDTPITTADPLRLSTQHIIDPTGWRWDSPQTISTVIKIKADTGQLDFQNIMAIPSFGYYQNSGLEYSSWNKLQGTNGWDYMNEARHGHGWFWWQPTVNWQNRSDLEKSKELELKLIINTKELESPYDKIDFPLSFGLKIHDYNYNNVLRFWLTFTSDPVKGMSHPYEQKAISTHTVAPPLMLKNTYISIPSNLWKIHNNIAAVIVPLVAQQGGIDWTNITGPEKGPSNKWFSWDTDHKSQLHGPITVKIYCKINNTYKPPSHFPVIYHIRIKDKHMQRYVIVQLKLTGNPYDTYRQSSKSLNQTSLQKKT